MHGKDMLYITKTLFYNNVIAYLYVSFLTKELLQYMNILKTFFYILCSAILCVPLVIVICQGEESKQSVSISSVSQLGNNPCENDDLEKCLMARDISLKNEDYEQAFSYLRTLCEKFKDSDSCYKTYSTYFSMHGSQSQGSEVRVTLYEVLYYLDIGCKLNNYDACMRAARIYEYGVKPGSSQALYGYNIAFDPQEAKRYYKKVCESVSDNAYEACAKIVDLNSSIGPRTRRSETMVSDLIR